MTDPNLKLSGLVNLIMDKRLCLKKVIADLFDIQFTLQVLKLFLVFSIRFFREELDMNL